MQLMAMLVGLSLTPILDDLPKRVTWLIFAILTAAHLYANYRAVSCVVFSVLNSEACEKKRRTFVCENVCWLSMPAMYECGGFQTPEVACGWGERTVYCSRPVLKPSDAAGTAGGAALPPNGHGAVAAASGTEGAAVYTQRYAYGPVVCASRGPGLPSAAAVCGNSSLLGWVETMVMSPCAPRACGCLIHLSWF